MFLVFVCSILYVCNCTNVRSTFLYSVDGIFAFIVQYVTAFWFELCSEESWKLVCTFQWHMFIWIGSCNEGGVVNIKKPQTLTDWLTRANPQRKADDSEATRDKWECLIWVTEAKEGHVLFLAFHTVVYVLCCVFCQSSFSKRVIFFLNYLGIVTNQMYQCDSVADFYTQMEKHWTDEIKILTCLSIMDVHFPSLIVFFS